VYECSVLVQNERSNIGEVASSIYLTKVVHDFRHFISRSILVKIAQSDQSVLRIFGHFRNKLLHFKNLLVSAVVRLAKQLKGGTEVTSLGVCAV
jgi:hypothetical protein